MARAMKVCSCIGCPAHRGSCPVITATGRCDRCDRQADRDRGTSTQRGYGSAWERSRAAYLNQPVNRLCALRLAGCTIRATVPDHHPVSRRDLVAQGVPDPDAWHRLRPLCRPCHGKATPDQQPGGWNAR